MRKRSFGEFMNKKKREGLRQLGLLQRLLEQSGLRVEDFLHIEETKQDPYIYCHNPSKSGSFDGIRIYKLGSQIAFRVQKESQTHPYGSAYPLNIEEMFQDFLSDDDVDEKKAGTKVIEHIAKEIKRFFEKSIEAEREERDANIEDDQNAGNVLVRTTGTDYSSLVFNKS